jgi:hypothetical protein
VRSTNEPRTSQEESLEDDHFFLWEPNPEVGMRSNSVPKLLCTVMDASSAFVNKPLETLRADQLR